MDCSLLEDVTVSSFPNTIVINEKAFSGCEMLNDESIGQLKVQRCFDDIF